MKFTLNWLKEYLEIDLSKITITTIADCLTEIGLEVESVTDKAAILKDFNVVAVTDVAPHPDADRLKICTVKTNQEEFKLVCGANNVTKNMKAILAPLGSIIPSNNMKVKKVKIRGVESIGMLCSAQELGLGDDHDGIIEVSQDTKIGTNIATLYDLDDPIIEIAITPNRGDCLGVYGIARDLCAAGIGKLKELNIIEQKAEFNSDLTITMDSKQHLNLLEIKNLENQESPKWLKNRLEAINITPKSALVDITNYVAYCFAQPLHIYDFKKLQSAQIRVRQLLEEEEFLALDGENYKLPKNSLVIDDQKQVLSLAGIIGGNSSACEMSTQHALLEAGDFDADLVAATGRKLQLDTDSRYRFERKIDPLLVKKALNYAHNLILEICANDKTISSNIVTNNGKLFTAKNVRLNLTRLNMIASANIEVTETKDILEKLGFTIISADQEEIELEVPSWRNDIEIEADLIEEILRIRGFNKIPYVPFTAKHKIEANNYDIKDEFILKKLLANLGLDEVITWSFYSTADAKNFSLTDSLQIQNPISSDLSVMRSSLIVNLVNMALKEQKRANNNYAIFEYGNIFNDQEQINQETHIAGLRMGENPKEINNYEVQNDIFAVKNDIFSIIELIGINEQKITLSKENLPTFLHPKRAARLLLGKKEIGFFGELHPQINKNIGLKQRVNLFALNLSNLPKMADKYKAKKYSDIDLQPLARDFCFIIDEEIGAGEIKKEIYKIDNNLIQEVRIFDLYQGEKIAQGKKSVAYNVILQPQEKSFTGDELELFNNKVIDHITQKFSATLP